MTVLVLPNRTRSMVAKSPKLGEVSLAASEASHKIEETALRLNRARQELQPLSDTSTPTDNGSTVAVLGDRNLALKRLLSVVAMHLEDDWRATIIKNLDRIMDPEDWEDDFELPSIDSFSTFLRAMVYLHPTKRPGIGLSQRGTFLGAWRNNEDRVVFEFLPLDEIKWVISRTIDDENESGAGTAQTHRIPEIIAPYHPEVMFEYAN